MISGKRCDIGCDTVSNVKRWVDLQKSITGIKLRIKLLLQILHEI